MRSTWIWLFVIVILANLALAAYLWSSADAASKTSTEFSLGTRLEFRESAENPDETLRALSDAAAEKPAARASASTGNQTPPKTHCFYWGPFSNEARARARIDDLLAEKVLADRDAAVLRSEQIQRDPTYLIFLGPFPNRQAAAQVRGELSGKQVDASVVIRDGQSVVSVGVFSQKRFADAQIAKVRALGYEPQQSELVRSQRAYFVMADLDQKTEERLRSSLLNDAPELQPADRCSLIASQNRIL